MKRLLIPFLWLFMLPLSTFPQSAMSWDEFVEYVTQHTDLSSSDDEESDHEEWLDRMEDLQQMHLAPLNINTASKHDLLTLPFLTERQASDIRDYIEKYHGMRTLYELVLVPSLHVFERRILPLFVYAGTTEEFQPKVSTLKQMLDAQRHEWTTRIDLPLYHRKGFLVEDGYRGARLYNRTRYAFSATHHLQASLRMERDAGERGIDSYGGQVMLKDFGHLETLVVGDFKASFGEGLVLNQSFSMGKGSLLTQASQGIKAHTGFDEHQFLRGVGVTLRWGDVHLSTFASHRRWDATLHDDHTVKSLITSGYHRTDTEQQKKGNVHAHMWGADLTWRHQGWHAGATGYFLHTSLPLNPGTTPYRQIYPHGSRFGAMGIHYGYAAYRWALRGETAYSTERGGLATLHTLSWQPVSRYRLAASQRFYSYRYYSFFASSLSDNTRVQNETGATLRMDATPIDGLQLSAYADFFYNPWPRYGLTHSSQGMEFASTAHYTLNRRNSLIARYSFKDKEYSSGRQMHHRLRLQWKCQSSSQLLWQTSAMMHVLKGSQGVALGETLRYGQSSSQALRFAASAIYFYTTDYNSRISLYEPHVSGALSIPSCYGHGLRLAGTLQGRLFSDCLLLELRYGFTGYFDRSTQSSGLQTIYSRYKNDITLNLKVIVK